MGKFFGLKLIEGPHLSRAPIAEAVIDFRARVASHWDEKTVSAAIKSQLSDYTKMESLRGLSVNVRVSPNQPEAASSQSRDLGWMGLKLSRADHDVAAFTRDGFSFSRLSQYENWSELCKEALRLWEIHSAIAGITAIERIGVRYINRIEVPPVQFNLGDYFQGFTIADAGLTTENFFHHDALTIPGSPYGINVIRTIQPGNVRESGCPYLILDIDVYLREQCGCASSALTERLEEMRRLKNHVFFSCVTQEVIKRCQ